MYWCTGKGISQVAGCRLKFNYNWNTAGTLKKRTGGRLTLFTVAQKGDFHLSAKLAEVMGGEYIPMILSLQ